MQVLDTYTAVLDEVVHVASQADTEEGKETGCIDEPRREFGPRMSWRMCENTGVAEWCKARGKPHGESMGVRRAQTTRGSDSESGIDDGVGIWN